MVAGIDVLLFKPERRAAPAWRSSRSTPGVDGRVRRGPHAGGDRRRARRERGGPRVARRARGRSRTPGSTWRPGDGLYHYYGSWYDDPSIPYASRGRPRRARCKTGEQVERPTRGARARARPARGGVRRAARRGGAARTFDELLGALAHGLPVRRGAQVLSATTGSSTRWWNKVREFGAPARRPRLPRGRARTSSSLGRHEVAQALDELLLTWATGGAPLGPTHWPPIVARRKELLERLARLDAAAGDRRRRPRRSPTRCRSCSGASRRSASRSGRSAEEGGLELTGAAASPGVVEGPRGS